MFQPWDIPDDLYADRSHAENARESLSRGATCQSCQNPVFSRQECASTFALTDQRTATARSSA